MKPGKPLKRVALKRAPWLPAPRKPIAQQSARVRSETTARRKAKAEVVERDQTCALLALDSSHACFGNGELHHVLKATRGGKYTAANGRLLCSLANQLVEDYPTWAESLGLSLPSGPVAKSKLLYDRKEAI